MSLGRLMRHWTRPGAVAAFHIALPPGRAARSALHWEVRALHDAFRTREVVVLADIVDALLSGASSGVPSRLGGPRGTYGRVPARRQYLGLAYGFEAGLTVHGEMVRGREQDAWNPEGQHWSVTRQLLEHRDGIEECLAAVHPEAEQEWSAVLDDLLDGLGQHPGLLDIVDWMIVHGQRDPSGSFQGPAERDLARWTAWSLARGFVLGADIVAHHATRDASARAPALHLG